jgi:hypothetical protein
VLGATAFPRLAVLQALAVWPVAPAAMPIPAPVVTLALGVPLVLAELSAAPAVLLA